MRELTQEEQVLLHLLAVAPLSDLPQEVVMAVDWQQVMRESVQQAVCLQAFDAAAKYRAFIPEEVYRSWFMYVGRLLSKNALVGKAQADLVALLEQAGYAYCILKGAASAAYYPRPELRTLGDVDFLIEAEKKEEIEALLENAGYESVLHEHECHVVFKKPDAHLEMHFEVAGIPHGEAGKRVRAFMENALASVAPCEQDGHRFVVPDAAYHGVILLLHMQHHMLCEGLGLRHLIDWAMFVHATAGQPFWEETLLPFLHEIGLFTCVAVMTHAVAKYLLCDCPAWAADVPETLCDAVMSDVLTGGNFGRKEPERRRAGMLVSEHGKDGTSRGMVCNLYRTLHKTTPMVYPIAGKIKALHPVLDGVRVIAYLCKTLRGKRPSIVRLVPHAKERRAVYEQLHIFEIEKTGDET